MKIRAGFVSNSSSSSFIIRKDVLSPQQIRLIRDHLAEGTMLGLYVNDGWDDSWAVRETDDTVEGSTIMDNFDMEQYLRVVVKVNMDEVTFRDVDVDTTGWNTEEQ